MIPLLGLGLGYSIEQRETEKPCDECERGEWKSWLETQHLKKTKTMASGPTTSWQIEGEKLETVTDFIFLGSKITVDGDCSHKIKRCLLLERKALTNLNSILKRRDIILLTKVHLVKAMVFPVVMYGCESWTTKKAERERIGAFELWYFELLRVPWSARRSNQSILRNQSQIFIGRTDAEAETPILWPPDAKNWLIGKDPYSGKDWRQEKGITKDETVGWHHQLHGNEFKQAPGVADGQGSLVCCSSRGPRESDTTEWLNWQKA